MWFFPFKGMLLKYRARNSEANSNLNGQNKVEKALLFLPFLPGQWPPVVHHLTLCHQRVCDRHRGVRNQGIRRECALIIDFHINGSSAHLGEIMFKRNSKIIATTHHEEAVDCLVPLWFLRTVLKQGQVKLWQRGLACVSGSIDEWGQKLPDTWASHTRCDPLLVSRKDPSSSPGSWPVKY